MGSTATSAQSFPELKIPTDFLLEVCHRIANGFREWLFTNRTTLLPNGVDLVTLSVPITTFAPGLMICSIKVLGMIVAIKLSFC
jgi:hypothetical protein